MFTVLYVRLFHVNLILLSVVQEVCAWSLCVTVTSSMIVGSNMCLSGHVEQCVFVSILLILVLLLTWTLLWYLFYVFCNMKLVDLIILVYLYMSGFVCWIGILLYSFYFLNMFSYVRWPNDCCIREVDEPCLYKIL